MFVDIYYSNKNANFQLCMSSGFRDMTLTNLGKRSFSLRRNIYSVLPRIEKGHGAA